MRWYYVSTSLVMEPVRGDAAQYVAYAWNLTEHHTFAKDLPGSPTLTPDNYRDPGYPVLLSLLMKAFGTGDAWYASVLLFQALLGALTVAVATQTGRYWLSSRWAICAGMLMAIWPHSISINGYLLTETLFSFLCALGLLLLARACNRKNVPWGFAAGTVLGAAALTNAVLLPFAIVLAGLLGWRKAAPRNLCIALAAGAMLLPGAWAIRNTQLPSPSSSESSLGRAMQNFAQGASPEYHAAYRDAFFGDTNAKARASLTVRAVEADYALLRSSPLEGTKAFLQKVGKQPLRYAVWYLIKKPVELWSWDIVVGQGDIYVYPTTKSPFQSKRSWIALEAVCQALNFLLLLMAATSIFFVASSRNFARVFPTKPESRASLGSAFLLFAFVTLVYSLLQSEPRYSIPFRPFEILLAFTSAAGCFHFWRSKKHSQYLPPSRQR